MDIQNQKRLTDEILRGGLTGTNEEIAHSFLGTVVLFEDSTFWDLDRIGLFLIGNGVEREIALVLGGWLTPQLPYGPTIARAFETGTARLNDGILREAISAQKLLATPEQAVVFGWMLKGGMQHGPYWQAIGLASPPTAEDVRISKEEIKTRAWVERILHEILHESKTVGKTIAQVKCEIAAAELLTIPEPAK